VSQLSVSTPVPRRLARGAAALAVAVAVLTACGGDPAESEAEGTSPATTAQSAEPTTEATTEAPAGDTQTITATEDDFSISLDEDSLSAGSYEIEVVNEGGAVHDLVVERDGEKVAATETIAPGESTTLTVDLEAGDYVFYCSIANHRGMGMEIDVTVA
jgi:plastocyanin